MKPVKILVILLVLATSLVLLFLSNRPQEPDDPGKGIPGPGTNASSPPEAPAKDTKSPRSAADREAAARQTGTAQLDEAMASLQSIAGPAAARAILSDLRKYLATLPPDLAAAAITNFLDDPARDADTQLGFKVGQAGFLDDQPSLRVALLDWLLQIDPQQAGAVAERILTTPTYADEWAICLRNYAISKNLLTTPTTAQGADLATHDRAALILVTQWLSDPAFEPVNPHIQTMHKRLTTFVGQTAH